ncbi:MAG: hypothetical protein HY711_11800 [Candidatus Melainabacteria bacterium]|nr:hypothetical protein [Candidatus Melainabacteria bacterium]
MLDNLNNDRDKQERRSFEEAMAEVAGLLYRETFVPAAVNFFSRKESHEAARQAGTKVFARLAESDPLTDNAYAQV